MKQAKVFFINLCNFISICKLEVCTFLIYLALVPWSFEVGQKFEIVVYDIAFIVYVSFSMYCPKKGSTNHPLMFGHWLPVSNKTLSYILFDMDLLV